MNSRKVMAAVIAAGVCGSLVSSSCNRHNGERMVHPAQTAPPKQTQRPENPDVSARRLEKQLSKYEPWIGSLLDLDSTDGNTDGVRVCMSTVPISKMIQESDIEYRKRYLETSSVTYALFDSRYNVIIIAPGSERYVDHEIAHALSVPVGGEVSLSSPITINLPSFSGPSIASINEISEKRAKKLREEGALSMMNEVFDATIRIIKKSERWGLQVGTFDALHKELSQNRYRAYMKEDARIKRLKAEMADMEKKADGYRSALAAIEIALASVGAGYNAIADSDFPPKGRCPGDYREITDKLKEAERRMDGLRGMARELEEFEAFNKKAGAALGGEIVITRSLDFKEMERKSQRYKMLNTLGLGSRGETFARMMHSLLSVYVGEDCSNLFRLNGEEIGMFMAMRQNGIPMFSKAVEKYRIALDLAAAGMDSEAISANLEFAEGFVHGQKAYSWKKSDVRFIGEIQKIDRITAGLIDTWLGKNKVMPMQNLF